MDRPKFFEIDIVDKLNQEAFNTLKYPIFLYYQPSNFTSAQSYQELFLQNVLSLYALYKDYGKNLLKQWVNANFSDGIRNDMRSGAKQHYYRVLDLRSYFAHGGFDCYPNEEKVRKCHRWFASCCNEADEYIPNNEKEWECCNEQLVKETNDLYQYILDRITAIKKMDNSKKVLLRRKFMYGDNSTLKESLFCASFDKQLCYDLIQDAYKRLSSISVDSNKYDIKEVYSNNFDKWANELEILSGISYCLYNAFKDLIYQDCYDKIKPKANYDNSDMIFSGLSSLDGKR